MIKDENDRTFPLNLKFQLSKNFKKLFIFFCSKVRKIIDIVFSIVVVVIVVVVVLVVD